MLLTTVAALSDWVSAQTPLRKECRDDVGGMRYDVLASYWSFALDESRGKARGVTLETDG